MTVCQPLPRSRATAATDWACLPTRRQAAFRARSVSEKRGRHGLRPLGQVRRGQARSRQRHRRLCQRSRALRPNASTSRTTVSRQSCRLATRGIDVVTSDPDALAAFRFPNRVMWQQRVHSVAASKRLEASRAGRPPRLRDALVTVDVPDNRSWRPSQLAFLLRHIPSLVDPAHEERTQPGVLIDLLHFPTGGG
jgi:hypothetical protein